MFGSTTRGEAGSASDVDLLLELDHSATLGLFDLVEFKEASAERLGRLVDIAFRSGVRTWFAAPITLHVVRLFRSGKLGAIGVRAHARCVNEVQADFVAIPGDRG